MPDIQDLLMAAYARQAKDTQLVEWATEIKVRAERRAGEMLAQLDRKNGQKGADGVLSTLERIEVPLVTAHRWQKLAAVPEDQFEAAIAAAKEVAGEVTTAALLRIQGEEKKKDRRAEVERQRDELSQALPDEAFDRVKAGTVPVAKAIKQGAIYVLMRGAGLRALGGCGIFRTFAIPAAYGCGIFRSQIPANRAFIDPQPPRYAPVADALGLVLGDFLQAFFALGLFQEGCALLLGRKGSYFGVMGKAQILPSTGEFKLLRHPLGISQCLVFQPRRLHAVLTWSFLARNFHVCDTRFSNAAILMAQNTTCNFPAYVLDLWQVAILPPPRVNGD